MRWRDEIVRNELVLRHIESRMKVIIFDAISRYEMKPRLKDHLTKK